MAQFGAGSELAAQCPRVPPPDGWRLWADADGPIPDALVDRAKAITDDASIPLGTTESFPLPGTITPIRVEPHLWARDASGALIEGCFRASGVYLPSTTSADTVILPSSTSTGWDRAATILTVVSLAVGTGATLAAWARKRK